MTVPSNMNCILDNGLYKIFNVKYSGQDVDLFGGQPAAPIVGYVNNSNSLNMVWNLTNVEVISGMQVTLTNAAPTANGTYAFVNESYPGAVLQGSSKETTWTLKPIVPVSTLPQSQCQYQIQASGLSNLAWSLASGDNGAPITLAPMTTCNVTGSLTSGDNNTSITVQPACNDTQVWTFKSVGNMARGINGLD